MKVTVEIDLEPKMWWKLQSEAEHRRVRVGVIIAELLTKHRPVKRTMGVDRHIEAWKASYETGVSAHKIADRYDVDTKTVINRLRAAGVTIRSRGEGAILERSQRRAVPHV